MFFLSKTISFNSKWINFFLVRNVGRGEGVTECLTVRYLGGEGGQKQWKIAYKYDPYESNYNNYV